MKNVNLSDELNLGLCLVFVSDIFYSERVVLDRKCDVLNGRKCFICSWFPIYWLQNFLFELLTCRRSSKS